MPSDFWKGWSAHQNTERSLAMLNGELPKTRWFASKTKNMANANFKKAAEALKRLQTCGSNFADYARRAKIALKDLDDLYKKSKTDKIPNAEKKVQEMLEKCSELRDNIQVDMDIAAKWNEQS